MGERRKPTSRRRTNRKKKSGFPFLYLLLFVCVVVLSAHYATQEGEGLFSWPQTAVGYLTAEKREAVPLAGKPEEMDESTKDESTGLFSNVIASLTGKKNAKASRETTTKKENVKEKTSMKGKEESSLETTGQLALVIDDGGRDLSSQHIYESLGIPLTLAVMPDQPYTKEAAESWVAAGGEVIVHQPMEPIGRSGMEAKTVLTTMSDEEIRALVEDSISQVPHAIGMNNHQGSAATTDNRTMKLIMSQLYRHRYFFLDSRTNSTTVADGAAATYGVPYARNGLFIDNSTDEEEIRAMIQEGAHRAKKNGTYIIIGHCRPHTAAAVQDMVEPLRAQGITFIFVSTVVR